MLGQNKGIVYTGTTVLFLIVFLFFAVSVYENKELSKGNIISNSLTNQITSIENSIELSIKKIFEINKNLTFNTSTIKVSDSVYIDVTTITTTLMENGPTKEKFEKDMNSLRANYTYFYPQGDMDVSTLLKEPLITLSEGIKINKTSLDLAISSTETLQIYYNHSGKTLEGIIGIEIHIISDEPIRDIIINPNTITSDKSTKINISINDINYPSNLINPEIIDDEKNASFEYGEEYIFEVKNQDTSNTYLNISLGKEVINITALEGNHNVTVRIYTESNLIPQDLTIPLNILNISIPNYHAITRSKIKLK